MKIIFNPFPEVDMSDLPLVFCMANIPNYVLYVEILKRLYCIYLYALCHLSGRACRTIPWCFSVSGRSPRVPPGSHSADLEAGEPGSGRSVVQREEQRDGGGDGLSATAEGWGFNYTPVHSSVHLYTHTHTHWSLSSRFPHTETRRPVCLELETNSSLCVVMATELRWCFTTVWHCRSFTALKDKKQTKKISFQKSKFNKTV